ncbi:MAG: hypothetical protein JKY56_24460 [Kofleriaceae bacterium]|nr:hypothetical protein [Kofleriaceae bacterium]
MFRNSVFALVLLSSACGSQPKDSTLTVPVAPGATASPVSAAVPIQEPSDVIASVQLVSGNSLGELAKAVDFFAPGMSTMAQFQLAQGIEFFAGMDLSGADINGSVAALLLSPNKYESPIVMRLKVLDADALRRAAKDAGKGVEFVGNLAIIGDADAVKAASHYAFNTLSENFSEFGVTLYPQVLLALYDDEIEERLSNPVASIEQANPFASGILDAYLSLGVALGEMSERLDISISSESGEVNLLLDLHPAPDSALASFIAVQVPSNHDLLPTLGATGGGMIIMSGELRAGSAKKQLLDQVSHYTALMMGDQMANLNELMRPWLNSLDGRVVMSMTMPITPDMLKNQTPMSMRYIMGSTDSKTMMENMRTVFAKMATSDMESMGVKLKTEFKPKIATEGDVEIDYYSGKFDLDTATPEQRIIMEPAAKLQKPIYLATFDDVAVMAMGDNSDIVKKMIRAGRGQEPPFVPGRSLAQALASSKAKKESVLFYMGIGSMMPAAIDIEGFTMALGKNGDALRIRFSASK